MRILHTYCLNYNLGDHALGVGVKNIFRHYCDVDYIGETNIQGRYFTEYYIKEVVNKKYDLLVIGGGGIIHGSHWPNGWFWLIDKRLIKEIKIPFILFSVGDNYFEDEIIPSIAIEHIKETYNYAKSFSVRNDGSYERVVKDFSINPLEIPDPGFFVGLNKEYSKPIEDKYVIIQIANDKIEHRIGSSSNIDIFANNMREVLKEISKKYKIIIAPHVFSDIALSKRIIDGITNCYIWDFGKMAFDNVKLAISYYKYAEFVLSMRGHGQIIPISFNVPTIALCNHPKHRGLMDKLNLGEYAVDVNSPSFTNKLKELINIIESDKVNIKNKLATENDIMRHSMTEFFNKTRF